MVPVSATEDARTGERTPGIGEQEGIWITAYVDDWHAPPTNLSDRVTPIRLRITNHSSKPIRVLYQNLALIGQRGRAYQPLPIVRLDHQTRPGSEPVVLEPAFKAAKFFVAPRYRDVYPSLSPWDAPMPLDESFYERQYQRWGGNLPTKEMQAMALPEGVLVDGGEVSGFVYFENATAGETTVVLVADIEDEQSATPLASIKIPFRVE